MIIRKAEAGDVLSVAAIYEDIHTAEESGQATIGWVRGIYPTVLTAQEALERGNLFVQEDEGKIVGAAIINQVQCDGYESGDWEFEAKDSEVMVLHTLVISPRAARRGYGKAFVGFYESYAKDAGCQYLRMDTNERNSRARAMYASLGYKERGVIATEFNGIACVNLVLLEKAIF